MASEDVIELGSSDDEPDPAPKKAKPRPNAMVHIPSNIQGVTIKPTKMSINSVSKKRTFPGKGVPIVNPNLMKNPYSAKIISKPNGCQSPSVKVLSNPIQIASKSNLNPMSLLKSIKNSQLNIKKVTNSPPTGNLSKKMVYQSPRPQSQKCLNKLPPGIIVKKTSPIGIKPTSMIKPTSVNKQPFVSKPPVVVSNRLVTYIRPNTKLKRPGTSIAPAAIKKKKINPNPLCQVGEVLTVELDDDDASQSSASPQWYLRPEDLNKNKQLDEQKSLKEHSEEPEVPKFIEITIEDSPIKPPKVKRTYEVQEDSITIDDSPVKSMADKNKESDSHTASGSDDEKQTITRTPNSKKKLQYPEESEVGEGNENKDEDLNTATASGDGAMSVDVDISQCPKSIEIEIEPMEISETELVETAENSGSDKSIETNEPVTKKDDAIGKITEEIIIEIEESPAKKEQEVNKKALPRKTIIQPKLLSTNTEKSKETSTQPQILSIDVAGEPSDEIVDLVEDSDFHPIYQNFIDMCFKLENSEDMKKIVEKKIKTYYRQVPKDYTESEEFLEMVSSKILAMKSGPDKMYLYIKDIVDELNLQRKIAKSEALNNAKRKEMEAAAFYGEEIEQDSKRKRQVRKLEKTLKKLHRAIQKLEDQEVDFDDDGDSVYILTESEEETPTHKDRDKPTDKQAILQRYKERLVRVHAKLCQLSNTKMPSEPRLHMEPRPGQPAGPARRLEKWINRRVPVGTPLPFPDFHDVLRCVRDANKEDDLGWNEADIMEEARDLFTRCGKKLQRRRQENEWRLAASRISGDADPAEISDDLKRKLDGNRKLAAQKESELINKFADRQKQLKLEAVEIGDKEADESPVESGDDAPDDPKEEDTLESREERKDRLKRLLKEKAASSQNGNESPRVIRMDIDDAEIDKADMTEKADEVVEILPDKTVEKTNKEEPEKSVSNKDVAPRKEDSNKQNIEEAAVINTDKSVVVQLQRINMEVEICTEKIDEKKNEEKAGSDSVQTLSDDRKKVDSDVDELHLLQKLHSENDIASSTLESSDTDTPIAISDTLESSDGPKNKDSKTSSDVVSIENSSYSETENTKDDNVAGDKNPEKKKNECNDDIIVGIEFLDVEVTTNIDQAKKLKRNSNEEYSEPVEDILLASSDEESNQERLIYDQENSNEANDCNYVNLKDDTISIGETVIESTNITKASKKSTSGSPDNNAVDSTDVAPNNNEVVVKDTESEDSSNTGEIKEKEIVEINSITSAETITEEETDVNASEPEDSLPKTVVEEATGNTVKSAGLAQQKTNLDESVPKNTSASNETGPECTDHNIETIESNNSNSEEATEVKAANNEENMPEIEDLERELDMIYKSDSKSK